VIQSLSCLRQCA